jgi:hypothetical protein
MAGKKRSPASPAMLIIAFAGGGRREATGERLRKAK